MQMRMIVNYSQTPDKKRPGDGSPGQLRCGIQGGGGLAQRNPRRLSRRWDTYLEAAAFFTVLTCLVKLSFADSKLPLASWPSASLVFSVTPNTSWLFA